MNAPPAKPARLRIDIWSDVMCPWCIIGYKQLQRALADLDGEIEAAIRWRPFELNPDLPPEGEDLASHILRKYGRAPSPDETDRMAGIAEQAGYAMRYLGPGAEPERMIWNTLLAHKLLLWTFETVGSEAQTRLKLALFDAHFQFRRNVSDREVLIEIAESVGLNGADARAALDDEELSVKVRREEAEAMEAGITSVPLILIEGRYGIPGAQDPATYAAYLRKIVTRMKADAGSSAAPGP